MKISQSNLRPLDRESTSTPPASPHLGTSSPTATVPRRSIADRHCSCRLHTYMYDKRVSGSSMTFG